MSEELSQAVSFANSYFALADGLVCDLEHYLAEDVVLDWFGQTVKGRKNVAMFMKSQNLNSRHMFNEVNAIPVIEYRKQRPLRRKYHSLGGSHENGNLFSIRDDEENCNIKYKRKYYSDGIVADNNENLTGSHSPIDEFDMEVEMEFLENKRTSSNFEDKQKCFKQVSVNDLNLEKLQINSDFTMNQVSAQQSCKAADLNSDDVDNALLDLGKHLQINTVEIKETNVNEIEQKILQLREKNVQSLEEFLKTELGQGDGQAPLQLQSVKYIEACGVIELSRFANVKQIRKDIRKRQCRLQVAYSVRDNTLNSRLDFNLKKTNAIQSESSMESSDSLENTKKQSKLMNLQEIRQLGDKLVPHDVISDTDIDEDRNEFLKYLELQMHNKDVNVNYLVTPKYVKNQLIFDKSPQKLLQDSNDNRDFKFNYTIHLIIYESNTKCRLNLSHEFEREFSHDLQ